MTSYQELAQIVAAAMRASPSVAGSMTTARDEILVELLSGETFELSALFLPPTEVARLAGENA